MVFTRNTNAQTRRKSQEKYFSNVMRKKELEAGSLEEILRFLIVHADTENKLELEKYLVQFMSN